MTICYVHDRAFRPSVPRFKFKSFEAVPVEGTSDLGSAADVSATRGGMETQCWMSSKLVASVVRWQKASIRTSAQSF